MNDVQVDPDDFKIFSCSGVIMFLKTCVVGLFAFSVIALTVLLLLIISGAFKIF